jgi:hypothetical protein
MDEPKKHIDDEWLFFVALAGPNHELFLVRPAVSTP